MCSKNSCKRIVQDKMKTKYKIGDKVKIKSKKWYDENKNRFGNICLRHWIFDKRREKYCGQEMIIESIYTDKYYPIYKLENCLILWTEDMFD